MILALGAESVKSNAFFPVISGKMPPEISGLTTLGVTVRYPQPSDCYTLMLTRTQEARPSSRYSRPRPRTYEYQLSRPRPRTFIFKDKVKATQKLEYEKNIYPLS